MGGTSYSYSDRVTRSASLGYETKSREQIFSQRTVHASMNPKGITYREARDSEVHPNTVPIFFWLDVTGSMGDIPHLMVKNGLPTLMTTLIQAGIPDATLCFGAVGDHTCDNGPLQIGQFESGDAELDMWLTRTWLEGGGGGNAGESYLLAHYFSAYHSITDAWEKRKQKGFLFTIGDEPTLDSLPMSAVKEIMGDTAVGQASYSVEQLIKAAQEKWNVYHINVQHGYRQGEYNWRGLLGQNLINVSDYNTIPQVVAKIIVDNLILNAPVVANKPDVVQGGFTPRTEITEIPDTDTDSITPML